MKHMKQVEIPACTVTKCMKITCDFCSNDIKEEGYHFDEVVIERKQGVSYPDYHDETITRIDCCTTCWDKKVFPALQALGATFYTEETCY